VPPEGTTAIANSELDRMFALLALGDEILMNRLFILQIAAENGWQVAKEVSLYQAGALQILLANMGLGLISLGIF